MSQATLRHQHSQEPTDHSDADMIRIPDGTFRMGSDRHYPEEAPVHRVTVDAFWIDRTLVTNRQFRDFVGATGHVTFAEKRPDPKDFGRMPAREHYTSPIAGALGQTPSNGRPPLA
jgi:formylglycine-generating enzyme